MPVNERQKEVAKQIFRDRIGTVSNLEESTALYRALVTLRPKGFRGSLLKKINWPTSWAVLYDLSPAQISQNRELGAASEVFATVPHGARDKITMWKALLKAYFAGNPEPMSQINFPSWRAPNWMSDSEKREINEYIRRLYEAEEPLDSTMPVEEMSADDEVIAEMSANMGGEEETVVVEESATTTSPNVSQPSLFESLYALYGAYFRRAHGINDAEGIKQGIAPNDDMRQGNPDLRRSILGILALETLGYEYTGIKNFLSALTNRGFAIAGIRVPRNGNFNAYVTVDLKAHSASPSRYTSRNAYRIMQEACRVPVRVLEEQFTRPNNRGLQVFRFSGRGLRMVGLQVLSLNYMNGDIRSGGNGMTYAEGVRKINNAKSEALEKLRNAVLSTETPSTASALRDSTAEAQAQVERQASRASGISGSEDKFYFIGYQRFSPGLTFRQQAPLFYDLNGLNRDDGEFSYTFYFAAPRDGVYKLYRSVFNPSRIANVNSLSGAGSLKAFWNNSGQLLVLSRLNLQEVTDLLNRRKLRQMIVEAHDNTLTYKSSTAMQPSRNGGERVNADFDDIERIGMIEPAFTDNLRRLASSGSAEPQSTASQTNITLLNRTQLKSLATSPYSFAFGIEFEGFVRGIDRKTLSEKMREDGVKIYTTTGYKRTTPVEGEEPFKRGHVWRNESDSTVVGYDARMSGGSDYSGRGQTFEMVSNILNKSSDYKSGNNDWIPELEKYCESLAKNGVLIDPSSGVHVHVGYNNFNAEQTKNFFINSVLMIPVLRGLVSEAWKGRSWAKFPSNENLIDRLSNVANASGGQANVVRAYQREFGRDRYSWLNTTNYGSSKPTFEFRFQGSSIEKDTMVNTVKILQQIWKASLEGVIPIERGSGERQDSVLVDLLGNPLFSFARNRFAETELPNISQRGSNRFAGFDFPINASSIS